MLKIIETFYNKSNNHINFLECSSGKSYLSFFIRYLLSNVDIDIFSYFYGVDKNRILIDKCNQVKLELDYINMEFIDSLIIDFYPERKIDIVIALHACDTATDEAIVKGIELNSDFIIVVPCCQNQIRSQIKTNHLLTDITDFGLLRYRFGDILTDALRAQFLRGLGYSVELKEITSTRTTPKNLILIAKKKKSRNKVSLDSFNSLCNTFNIDSKLIELLNNSTYKN